MKTGLTVAMNERHVLRVFALDLPREAAERLRDATGRSGRCWGLTGLIRRMWSLSTSPIWRASVWPGS